ncbi:hypothetical protein RvVAR031_29590 [Agrobacterium vitis]|nr:hypothetical protein RvVAR031_29590 [Agrobacterium vitis]
MWLLSKPMSFTIRDIPFEMTRVEPARVALYCYERWESMCEFEICGKALSPAGWKICWFNSSGMNR